MELENQESLVRVYSQIDGFFQPKTKILETGDMRISKFYQFYRYETDIKTFSVIQKYRYVGDTSGFKTDRKPCGI